MLLLLFQRHYVHTKLISGGQTAWQSRMTGPFFFYCKGEKWTLKCWWMDMRLEISSFFNMLHRNEHNEILVGRLLGSNYPKNWKDERITLSLGKVVRSGMGPYKFKFILYVLFMKSGSGSSPILQDLCSCKTWRTHSGSWKYILSHYQ